MAHPTKRQRIWGWMFFDWAQQPYATLGLTFIFSPYFAAVAADYFLSQGATTQAARANAQGLWSSAQTAGGLVIAFSAPLLGAWADATGRKRPWFWLFTVVAILSAFSLWQLKPDGTGLYLALALFWVGFVASESAFNLNNAILPSLGTPQEVGRISGTATAFGYWGGVLALMVMLLFFAENETGKTLIGLAPPFGLDAEAREGTRFVGPFIGLWFAIFLIPFFMWNHDDPLERKHPESVGKVLGELRESLRRVWKRKSCRSFLLSSLFYRDALTALYAYGGIYATLVLDWRVTQVGVFGIVAAIAAAVLSWVGGLADERLGPKAVIRVCIWVLILVGCIIVGMSRDFVFSLPFPSFSPFTSIEHATLEIFGRIVVAISEKGLFFLPLQSGSVLPDMIFYLCGASIGGAGGALFSASRSMMVRHCDPLRPAEGFGLFALAGKATAFVAPALITLFTYVTQSNQLGFLPVIGLFLLGLVLLFWVQPQGDRPA